MVKCQISSLFLVFFLEGFCLFSGRQNFSSHAGHAVLVRKDEKEVTFMLQQTVQIETESISVSGRGTFYFSSRASSFFLFFGWRRAFQQSADVRNVLFLSGC